MAIIGWRSWIAASAVVMFGCAPVRPPQPVASPHPIAPQQQQQGEPLQLVDLTDDFARIYDRDAALPETERVARFKSEFAAILPGFYTHERVEAPVAKYDEYLLKGIKRFPEQRAGIERVASELAGLLVPAQRSFEAAFGPMRGYPRVYLVNSLGEFDGGTRDLPEGTRLMFGADMIDKFHRGRPIQPFFHHELFHLLHNRSFSECDTVWCGLWTEGLAVYVAAKLNPGASDDALLLTFPVPLRAAVEKDRPRAICLVTARLDSTDTKVSRALFSNGQLDEALPGRFGYYVGLLIAEDLGRSRSLSELAALSHEQVQPLIRESLARMANCQARPVERG